MVPRTPWSAQSALGIQIRRWEWSDWRWPGQIGVAAGRSALPMLKFYVGVGNADLLGFGVGGSRSALEIGVVVED